MAKKSATTKVIRFQFSGQEKDAKPTAVWFKPFTKGEFDEWQESLYLITKKGKVETKRGKAFEFMLDKSLTPNTNGVFVENALYDGKDIPEIKDKAMAIKYLIGLEDIDAANELETAIRGQSTLDEEETKNSDGQ